MRELDVREVAPADRHDRIHEVFESLDAGETLVVNDHDPKPLSTRCTRRCPRSPEGYEVEQRGADEFRA